MHFFWVGHFEFFFAFFPWKLVKVYWLARMGQNFDQVKCDNTFWPMPNILKGSVSYRAPPHSCMPMQLNNSTLCCLQRQYRLAKMSWNPFWRSINIFTLFRSAIELQAFLHFRGFDFCSFRFTVFNNSILFSSPLVLLSNLDLRSFFFHIFLCVFPH